MKLQMTTGLIVTLIGFVSTEFLLAGPVLVVNEMNGDMQIEVRGEDWILSAYQIFSPSMSLIPDPDLTAFNIPGMGTPLANSPMVYAAGIPLPPPTIGFAVVEEGIYPLGIRFSGEQDLEFQSAPGEADRFWPVEYILEPSDEYIPEPSGVCLMVLGIFGLGRWVSPRAHRP